MDLQMLLGQLEADFFHRLDSRKEMVPLLSEVKKDFNEAIKNVLVLSYARIMKDANEG